MQKRVALSKENLKSSNSTIISNNGNNNSNENHKNDGNSK